jgi:hypothetical protein
MLMSTSTKVTVFWDKVLCTNPASVFNAKVTVLKTKATGFSEMLLPVYQTSLSHISDSINNSPKY